METTRQNLIRERARAIKERTPMKIQECKMCKEILPAEAFSNRGRKNHICRLCSLEALKLWKEHTGGGKGDSGYYYRLKSRAKRKGIEWTLTRDKFAEWIEKQTEEPVCFYCQQPLDPTESHTPRSITIDRMDNKKGYDIGNMAIVCGRCNSIKGAFLSAEEMLEIAEKYLVGKETIENQEHWAEKARERKERR